MGLFYNCIQNIIYISIYTVDIIYAKYTESGEFTSHARGAAHSEPRLHADWLTANPRDEIMDEYTRKCRLYTDYTDIYTCLLPRLILP
jgi:hypothetical protein